ncbi:exodeoxyribonuclease V subunit gamma [Thermomonas paludicola]|uniref:exodeoxyribonuclease V subunit gamma n=1 Tax=Thermomonas paludicola TaxID=2884874 RepID=UPI002115076E|nr:exodeoxyribonuclease V subunit gamma [Thermomonas paludicola]
MNTDETSAGLTLLRASRLEALLEPLEALLAQTRPAHPLAPQTVIAAHPGMKQWLAGALARQVGAGRVVANLDVQLPSTWLDRLSTTLLGERAVALPNYRRGHLRWTLHAMLGDPSAHGVTDPRVLAYLGATRSADERALRRFQLADRLARVFSQYLVYRSDWLQAWEAGRHADATAQRRDAALKALESGCLAPLWQAVVAALGEHRGRLVDALVAALQADSAPRAPLHVVGLSHLPPAELSVLRAYARRAPVFLYVPDPCREYWGGLHKADGGRPAVAAWQAFRDDEQARFDDPDALDWRDQGHPLLARWGRLGQHFFAALVDDELREDIRHWQDDGAGTPPDRLARLQDSIRRLQPELLQEDAAAANATADPSLRIHACHTRQRELEVLRDALLDAVDKDGVRPGDIVVMAPDIQAYLPLIPAVFGAPGSARERLLPYHLADVPVARSHPLFAVFATLLGLGASRITAPEVVDLLGVAEVRAALGLDAGDADILGEWLRNSRVAWALDAAHKQALSLPMRAEHSFAWAMDRLLAGYLMADVPGEADPQAVTLPDGTELLPLAGIEGPSAAALGSLDRLLCELQAWRNLAHVEQPASQWATVLRERVDALLRIDRTDADARAALSVVHRAIAQLAAEPARNGEDPALRLPVVRELLQDALAAAPERQRFLMGGITFCGMVPQRAIPFDMVCVLGLDEGAFPRRPSDGGIDLMARIRRLGDRDVPGDDRYLFLETVMSARKRLHLSYIGQGVRDGKHRNPAAPLAELLAELDRSCANAPDDDKAPRPWLVRHPLQPFDGRYFDGTHPALFSFSPAFAGMRGAGKEALPRLRDGNLPAPEPLPEPLPLATLEGFFKDPAKALLKEHLQLSLDALDDDVRLAEDEPMDAISRIHSVARTVFLQQVLPRKCGDPAWAWDRQPPAWVGLGGLLPLGAAGEAAWAKEADAVDALWSQADACGRFDARGEHGGQVVRVDVPLRQPGGEGADDGLPQRMTGLLRNVFPLNGAADGVQIVFAFPNPKDEKKHLKEPGDLGFKERVPAFLHWALLRLQHASTDTPVPVRLTMLAAGEPDLAAQVNAWDLRYCAADTAERAALNADLRRRLHALVALMCLGREGRSWFHPQSGWAALQALQAAPKKARGKQGEAEAGKEADGAGAPSAEAEAAAKRARGAAIAKAVRGKWVSESGQGVGERDYAPGYAQLLEGDLIFGDPDTDPDSRALHALLQDAQQINALIQLDGVDAPGVDASTEVA